MAGSTLTVVVADDDEPTSNLLKDLLESYEGVMVVGTADSGRSLLELVAKTNPDIIFADVQMPGLDGLTAVHQLQKEYPNVFSVFISAYPQYAAEAFDLDAVDYIIKPLSRDRVGRALAKGKRFKELQSMAGERVSLSRVRADFGQAKPDRHKRLFVKSGHGAFVVTTENILFIEKTGRKCLIHTRESCYETTENLSSIASQLDRTRFFRCHRSYIINVDSVEKISPYTDRAYEVTFHNYPRKATMRREAFENFCRLINERDHGSG
jgi:DNA-binding LytR/AlgR family response regulator